MAKVVEKEPDSPLGEFPVKTSRKERPGAAVAARVARLNKLAPEPKCIEAHDQKPLRVQQMNQGFFALERMRAQSVQSKKRTKKRAKLKGK